MSVRGGRLLPVHRCRASTTPDTDPDPDPTPWLDPEQVLKFTLSGIDHAICVSHTCRENLVLRASLDPTLVSAVPNAVDCSKFEPDATQHQVGAISALMADAPMRPGCPARESLLLVQGAPQRSVLGVGLVARLCCAHAMELSLLRLLSLRTTSSDRERRHGSRSCQCD